ncbi:cation:proton antiporter [Cumulibacter manganitolerans]|uniref:cation:proton antiporter n=1 Tax=Cumulibacter manganitolerans TaxID=1884992 RepID=UPI0012966745|nr:cation:proton antiporter [Cumulibacter manganitolerans]
MTTSIVLLLVGLALLLSVVLSSPLQELPISAPIILVIVGGVIGMMPFADGVSILPQEHPVLTEQITGMTVLVALMGVGLALDRPLNLRRWADWRSWGASWRLLGIAMPLCIGAVALLGWGLLGLAPAAALMIGAALAPTDPVLASDVQVEGPDVESEPEEIDERDEVRFSLTSEAGLNDGLAFPFVHAAILISTAGGVAGWGLKWVGWYLVGKIVIGVLIGYLTGWVIGKLAFRAPHRALRTAETGEPLLAVAVVLVTYGLTELAGGYGFLAVFTAAMTLRASERSHYYHELMHQVIERLERLMTLLLLLFLGYAVSSGLLDAVDWRSFVIAGALLFVIRPAFGWLSVARAGQFSRGERAAVAFFGVRGIGSLYYLAYATTHGNFAQIDWLWATVGLTVVASVLVHGIAATPVMKRLDREKEAA